MGQRGSAATTRGKRCAPCQGLLAVEGTPPQKRAVGLTIPARRSCDEVSLPERYRVQRLIGAGSYGSVYEVVDLKTDGLVAVKRIDRLFEDMIESKRILRELAILARLRHGSVVQILDVYAPGRRFDELYLVMEIGDSDMKQLFRMDVHMSPLHTTTLLYNLLLGVRYLHLAGVYHRDLKPANCLVNQDCGVKICDFGLARAGMFPGDAMTACLSVDPVVESAGDCMTSHVVTRWYRAPELILMRRDYGSAIDVWSVGCIFGELLQTHEGLPFEDRGPLFPGSSCFPLSPEEGQKHRHEAFGLQMMASDRSDQLSVIFDLIGTPSKSMLEQLPPQEQKYLQCFPPRGGEGFRRCFPSASPSELDVVGAMLRFSPDDRISVQEVLDGELISEVRKPEAETLASPPPRIVLDFETSDPINEEYLRTHFKQEIKNFCGSSL